MLAIRQIWANIRYRRNGTRKILGGAEMTEIRNTLAASLRANRASRRLTQQDVADRIGTSKESISNWENGENAINVDALVRLADFYGVSLDALVGREVSA